MALVARIVWNLFLVAVLVVALHAGAALWRQSEVLPVAQAATRR